MTYKLLVRTFACAVMVVSSQTCFAQAPPYIYSVQNSASYSRSVAQGSLFVIIGDGLGPAKLAQAASYPLALQLAGTSIKILIGTTTVSCPIAYTSASQIAAILPSTTPVGEGTIVVTYNDAASSPSIMRVVKSAFGVYSVASSGLGPGIVTGADYVTKTLSKPSKPGEIVVAWGTGLGPIAGGDSGVAAPGQEFSGIEVFVGDRAAKVIYAGRSGCCAGVDQIAFEVPDGPRSCFVPVSIRTAGGSSNFVSLPISDGGEACANPSPGIPTDVLSRIAGGEQLTIGMIGIGPVPVLRGVGFNVSQLIANQLSSILQVKVPEADVSRLIRAYRARNSSEIRDIMTKYAKHLKAVDGKTRNLLRTAAALEQQGAAAKFARSSGFAVVTPQFAANFPAIGTCTVLQNLPKDPLARTRPLDAGATLTVEGPTGRKIMTRISNGQYQTMLGDGVSKNNTTPGSYTVSGTGGKDIGAFSASLNIASSLVWTNKSAVANVDRTRSLTVTWSGGPASGHVWVGGASQSREGSSVFTCVEETRKGMFTIPQFVLAALQDAPGGTLFITPHPMNQRISAPGVDLAFIGDASTDSRTVTFR